MYKFTHIRPLQWWRVLCWLRSPVEAEKEHRFLIFAGTSFCVGSFTYLGSLERIKMRTIDWKKGHHLCYVRKPLKVEGFHSQSLKTDSFIQLIILLMVLLGSGTLRKDLFEPMPVLDSVKSVVCNSVYWQVITLSSFPSSRNAKTEETVRRSFSALKSFYLIFGFLEGDKRYSNVAFCTIIHYYKEPFLFTKRA